MTRIVSDPPTEAVKSTRVPSTVWILSAIAATSGLGYGMLGPSLPALADLYSVGAASVSLAVSGFAAGRLITNISLTGLLKKIPSAECPRSRTRGSICMQCRRRPVT